MVMSKKVVNINTAAAGARCRRRGKASSPVISDILKSSTITSGGESNWSVANTRSAEEN